MQFDKDIAMPAKKGRTSTNQYNFAEMQIGDSFLLADEKEKTKVRYAAKSYRKVTGLNFVIALRTTDDGIRAWRLS